ncbi:MAG: C-terminal binding protein [Chthoniobacterales bacterium]|nr:C-terminal binding protein [Chthoniobacterales bacterium]
MKTNKPHILVADWFAPDFALEEAKLKPLGWTWSMPEWTPPAPPREEQIKSLLARIKNSPRVDAVVFVLAPLPAQVIEALPPECRLLQRVGIGLDTLDLECAQRRGIKVDNTPEYAIEEVAVHALGMMLSLHRQLAATQSVVLAGGWRAQSPEPIERLSTLTLGLLGLGRIGRRVAELCKPLFSRVIFHDPAVTTAPPGLEAVGIEALFQQSDVLSLHCPLLPQTRDVINAKTLALMKPSAILINVSRGGLVDAVALAEALEAGRLAGAGLDVFEPEVLPADSPLRKLGDKVILTSHTAWYSRQSVIDCRTQAIEKVINFLNQQ